MGRRILTINGGSSTIKFAAFGSNGTPQRVLTGQVEGIGGSGAELSATETGRAGKYHAKVAAEDHRRAAHSLIEWIAAREGEAPFEAIGHRVVHGGVRLIEHQIVTPELLAELRRTQPLDLAHLPREIALIEAFRERFPAVAQIACFDTAFSRRLPRAAQILPIPVAA